MADAFKEPPLRLMITMYDGSTHREPARSLGSVEIDPVVEQRIIQEEVWAHTMWPYGEPRLADMIRAATKDYKVDERLHHAIQALAGIRAKLEGGAIGEQQAFREAREYMQNAFAGCGLSQEI